MNGDEVLRDSPADKSSVGNIIRGNLLYMAGTYMGEEYG